MSSKPEAFYKLKCSCNQYPWGKQGSDSMAARLCAKQVGWDGEKGEGKTRTDFKIDEDNSYAEMWMGTYPELPSYVEETGEDLQDVIDQYPDELVGKTVLEKFGHSKIPFLPKVLSIAKALPLQIHPNKEVATRLHKENPDQFTDPNHKPEIALALGKFEAFCGFKPLDRIEALLKLDPLKQYLPNDASGSLDDGQLKEVVRNMLEADKPTVKKTYDSLVSLSKDSFGEDTHILELAPRLASQYGETDPGSLVALITMNYLVLHAGDSIYIPADGIHAYLSGDIIECMARSNNVLNTGFCPRAERDSIDLFMQCLTFKPHSLEDSILKATKYEGGKEGKTLLYSPPMNEFDMLATSLKEDEKEVLKSVNGPSILIAAKGGAEMTIAGKKVQLGEGQVYFVAHGNAIELVAGKDGLNMYTSFVQ